jgi:hypothetical protein
MFVAPLIETEVEQLLKGLKKNSSAGFDEIPTFLVKQCLRYFIKPLVHMYSVFFFFSNWHFPRHDEKGKNKTVI